MISRIRLAAIVAFLILGATSAYADQISIDLTQFNVSGYTGPFGTVKVTTPGANSASASVTFTAATGYVFIDSSLADLNINAASFTEAVSGVTVHPTDSLPSVSPTGSGNVDGWGVFNATAGTNSGFASGLDAITFNLTNNSGLWANAASVLIANALGHEVAAHIAPLSADGQNTGFATDGGSSPPPAVPEPATLALLGSGLAALPVCLRRRRAP